MRILVHDYAGHPAPVDLSRELASRGHTVWHAYFTGDMGPKGVMTLMPSDPECMEFLPVSIGRNYSKSNFISRRNNDVRYGNALASQILTLKPEVVISGNTPLDAQGRILAATHEVGGVFVNWIQDFYSIAIQRLISRRWLGMGTLVASYYRWLDKQQLQSSDAAVLISEDFRKYLTGFEGRHEQVYVIPNWGAIEGIPVRPKANPWAATHGLDASFVFLYSGTLGLKHNPKSLLDLADAFASMPDVKIVVSASGVGRDTLDALLAETPRSNILLLPLQDFSDFPDMLGTSDVLVAILEADAGEFSVPSKVLSYLCAGRPIVLAAPAQNLASRMVASIPAGEVVASSIGSDLQTACKHLYSNSALRESYSVNAREYAEMNFSIINVADSFESVFNQALAKLNQRNSKHRRGRTKIGAAS